MKFVKLTAAFVLTTAIAACGDAGGTLQAQPGQSAEQVARSITQTRAIAQVIGTACDARGIKLRQPNIFIALSKDVENLKKQGYTEKELTAAFNKVGKDKRTTAAAISYLTSRGAKKGNAASLCKVGQQEIAQKTAVGQLLKRG